MGPASAGLFLMKGVFCFFFLKREKEAKSVRGDARTIIHHGVPPKTPLAPTEKGGLLSSLRSKRLAGANRKLQRRLSVGTLVVRRATGMAMVVTWPYGSTEA